jgi:hypothetical protein
MKECRNEYFTLEETKSENKMEREYFSVLMACSWAFDSGESFISSSLEERSAKVMILGQRFLWETDLGFDLAVSGVLANSRIKVGF